MKRTIGIVFLLMTLSCGDDATPDYDIYNEWQWVKTTFDTRGKPITSQDIDSTYYYTFTREGKLIVKNNSKQVVNEYDVVFEANDGSLTFEIQDLDVIFGYGIKSDTLRIWQTNSIWVRIDMYRRVK